MIDRDYDHLAELAAAVAALRDEVASLPRFSPGFWRNPLAAKMLSGFLPATRVGLDQRAVFVTSDFTTTDTTSYQDVATVAVQVPPGHLCLFAWATLAHKHSVAGASVRLAIRYVDAGGGTGTLQEFTGVGSGNQYAVATLSTGLDITGNLAAAIRGGWTLKLSVRNDTAGTLTVAGGGATTSLLHAFVIGDTSR